MYSLINNLFFKLINKFYKPLYCFEYISYENLNKKIDHEAVLLTLQKGINVLNSLKIDFIVSRGSLLGLNRGGKFLPGDNDIDIDIFSDEHYYKIIKAMPFEIILTTISNGNFMQLSFLDNETDAIFDIWFYHKKKNKYTHRNFFGNFWLPIDKSQKVINYNYNNINFPVYEDVNWYCNFWYGDNWRIPKTYTGHWTDSYKIDCKGFDFYGEKQLYFKNFIKK